MNFSLFLVSHVMLEKYFWMPRGSRDWLLLLFEVIMTVRLADGEGLLNHQLFQSIRTLLLGHLLEASA